MYQLYGDDEFEPRITPQPTTKLSGFITPTVPEVSLVFDKPHKGNIQYDCIPATVSNTVPQYASPKNQTLSTSNTTESYAAWKEQNLHCKTVTPQSNPCVSSYKSQFSNNRSTKFSNIPDTSSEELCRQRETHNYLTSAMRNRTVVTNERISNKDFDHSDMYMHRCQDDETKRVRYKQDSTKLDSPCPEVAAYNSESNLHSVGSRTRPPNVRKTMHDSDRKQTILKRPLTKVPVQKSNTNANVVNKNELPSTPYMGYSYPYTDMNGYTLPPFYVPHYAPHNIESQESVNNLLQLVNNQSEQIKYLQLQVERLLRTQEELLKDQKCKCSSHTQSCNQEINQNISRNSTQKTNSREQMKEIPNDNTDAQKKKTFVEQKVSIGVMTSFEFTVQNNPFILESDNHERSERTTNSDTVAMHSHVNVCNANESIRRYKNSLVRMPSGHLENIVEDSESCLSSSQQHSSNLNASTSTRDIERSMQNKMQNESAFKSSPLLKCQVDPSTPSHQPYFQKHFEMNPSEDIRPFNTTANNIQKNKEDCSIEDAASYEHASPIANRATMSNREKLYISKTNTTNKPIVSYSEHSNKTCNAIRKTNSANDSMVLSGGDLKVDERSPTPEPSIHVEMNEYSSDDESEKVKQTSKIGWTFYNNVLGQVNQILQDSCIDNDQDSNHVGAVCNEERENIENKTAIDTVKMATLEQLKKLGIHINENPVTKEVNGNKMAFDCSYYPRVECQANMTHTTSAVNETNTSMHMKALALKYLTDEQLAELAIQKHGSGSIKHLTLSNLQGTNMSFATMRYLERYQLLPGKNNIQFEGENKPYECTSPRPDNKFANTKNNGNLRYPFNQTPRTSCPSKILDISTLKQQPKLL